MGHKLFFMTVFLLVIGGIGLLAAFSFNFLPPTFYSFVYSTFNVAPSSASKPYLEKFEGHWQATMTPGAEWSDVAICPTGTATLTITDGMITGAMGSVANRLTVNAAVDASGNIIGTFGGGALSAGNFSGRLQGASGQGTWKNGADCQGTLAFNKIEPVNDPTVGTFLTFSGNVMFVRGNESRLPLPGENLYVGDVVTVPQGGSATLSVGGVRQTLQGPTTFTVAAK